MLRILILTLLAVVFATGIVIGYFNSQTIVFNYLFGTLELPLIALIVGEFVFVVLLTLLVVAARIVALKTETMRLRRQLNAAEGELRTLRNLPLKDA